MNAIDKAVSESEAVGKNDRPSKPAGQPEGKQAKTRKARAASKFALLQLAPDTNIQTWAVCAEGASVKDCVAQAIKGKVTGIVRAVCWHRIGGKIQRVMGVQETFGFIDLEEYHQYDTETERQTDKAPVASVGLRERREPLRVLRAGISG